MKKTILSLLVAMMAAATVSAQQIAVVSESGETNIYSTLAEAIEGAAAKSVIYLPGGGFPLSDEVKITKKLTIIGIGHNSQSENVDGRTLIAGNLFFNEGSDGSAVMGCYINGDVNIGTSESKVDGVLVKFCNLNSIQVKNSQCLETVINQNYIRNNSSCNSAKVTFTNNIMHSITGMSGGLISYNILVSKTWNYSYAYCFKSCDNCEITYNILLDPSSVLSGGNCQATGNMLRGSFGDDSIDIAAEWTEVFKNHSNVNPVSNYHFTEDYTQYEGKYGIYGGTGFSDGALPPVPYITYKSIPEQTDASGKLHIKIAVKAGE